MSSTTIRISEDGVRTVNHVWKIDDFHDFLEYHHNILPYQPFGLKCEFPVSTNAEVKWQLLFNCNPEPNGQVLISIQLYLSPESKPKKIFATFKVGFVDKENKKVLTKYTQVRQYITNSGELKPTGWGWDEFCELDQYFGTNLICDNALTIHCEVKFSPNQNVMINSFDERSLKMNVQEGGLADDFGSLLKTHAFSDAVISTKSKNFPVHKLILSARSKVFAAMFEHDTKENQTNRIEIEDMTEEVVGEMLSFIYTGRTKRVFEMDDALLWSGQVDEVQEMAVPVLAAADKYDLGGLKLISSKSLYKCLSTKNALEILKQAHMHNAKELKHDVIQFIAANASEVLAADEWKNNLSKSELVTEVCEAMARRLTSELPVENERL